MRFDRQRRAVVPDGGFVLAFFAQGRSQGDMEFRTRIAHQRRTQKRNRGVELAIGAQKIGEIYRGFQPRRLQRQHLAEELLRRIRQPQHLRGIAQCEQHAGVARLHGQGLFILGDGFHMPSLRRQLQPGGIGAHMPRIARAALRPR